MRKITLVLAALLCVPAMLAHAQESTSNHFTIERTVRLDGSPESAWEVFLQIGDWWDPDHTYGGDSTRLSLSAAPGGCFCEALPNGGFVEHMRVVYAEPNTKLRMEGGLGPLQEFAIDGSMTWSFEADGDGTVLTVLYRVAGVVDGGLDGWAEPIAGVLAEQLSRLRALIANPPARP